MTDRYGGGEVIGGCNDDKCRMCDVEISSKGD